MVTHITLVAVVGRFVLDPTLIGNLFAFSHQLVSQDLDVLYGLQQAVSSREGKNSLSFHQLLKLPNYLCRFVSASLQ